MTSSVDRLEDIYREIAHAVCAEDLFGEAILDETRATSARLDAVARRYEELARVVRPEAYDSPSARSMAADALEVLDELHANALRKVGLTPNASGVARDDHTYNHSAPAPEPVRTPAPEPTRPRRTSRGFEVTTERRAYAIDEEIARGELSVVYAGTCSDEVAGQIVAKIAYAREDNDLLRNEARALRRLDAHPARQSKHLPVLLDEFRTDDGRAGLILRRHDGLTLGALRERLPRGIPQRHVMWIMRRLLSVVGLAHSQGILHGNIEPAHVLVRPHDHNVWLIDWTAAVIDPARTGDRFKWLHDTYSAPEVAERKPPIPPADLYALGKTMIYALGGDPATDDLPPEVDERFARFLRHFTRASPMQRAQDAWQLYAQLDRLRAELYGPHTFVPFDVPEAP